MDRDTGLSVIIRNFDKVISGSQWVLKFPSELAYYEIARESTSTFFASPQEKKRVLNLKRKKQYICAKGCTCRAVGLRSYELRLQRGALEPWGLELQAGERRASWLPRVHTIFYLRQTSCCITTLRVDRNTNMVLNIRYVEKLILGMN